MELLRTPVESYHFQKILATATLAQTALSVRKVLSEEELKRESCPEASSIALRTPTGFLTQAPAIIKYISQSTTFLRLSESESVEVDKWLAFDDVDHILKDIGILENHISTRTFFVTEKITIADISLACACKLLIERGLFNKLEYPSMYRWLMTCIHHPKLGPVLGSDFSSSSGPVAGKWQRGRIRVKELLGMGDAAIGKEVIVKGWIRTARKGNDSFVELTDGSTVKGIQLVLGPATLGKDAVDNCGGVGASISAKGVVVASPAKGQAVEVHVIEAEVLGPMYAGDNGEVGGKNYPMAKKGHTLEFLREKAHLRPRTKVSHACTPP